MLPRHHEGRSRCRRTPPRYSGRSTRTRLHHFLPDAEKLRSSSLAASSTSTGCLLAQRRGQLVVVIQPAGPFQAARPISVRMSHLREDSVRAAGLSGALGCLREWRETAKSMCRVERNAGTGIPSAAAFGTVPRRRGRSEGLESFRTAARAEPVGGVAPTAHGTNDKSPQQPPKTDSVKRTDVSVHLNSSFSADFLAVLASPTDRIGLDATPRQKAPSCSSLMITRTRSSIKTLKTRHASPGH